MKVRLEAKRKESTFNAQCRAEKNDNQQSTTIWADVLTSKTIRKIMILLY